MNVRCRMLALFNSKTRRQGEHLKSIFPIDESELNFSECRSVTDRTGKRSFAGRELTRSRFELTRTIFPYFDLFF